MPIDATLPYDENNIFARILRGDLPSKPVYEDEFAFAFHDINPQAPLHIRKCRISTSIFLAASGSARCSRAEFSHAAVTHVTAARRPPARRDRYAGHAGQLHLFPAG